MPYQDDICAFPSFTQSNTIENMEKEHKDILIINLHFMKPL